MGAVHARRLRRRRRRQRRTSSSRTTRRTSPTCTALGRQRRRRLPATLRTTDFVGIAVHCAKASSSVCSDNAHAKPDLLPDEPRGYHGFDALYGAKYVDPGDRAEHRPATACPTPSSRPESPAARTSPTPTATAASPASTGWRPTDSLGYVEQMQEAGVPVTFAYISDVHDQHTPNTDDRHGTRARRPGPGEAAHEAQLAAYNQAFGDFFSNLAAHGINKTNTRVRGHRGRGRPLRRRRRHARRRRTDARLQPHDVHRSQVLPDQPDRRDRDQHRRMCCRRACPASTSTSTTPRRSTSTASPTATDPGVRKLEQDVGDLTSLDPYVRNSKGNGADGQADAVTGGSGRAARRCTWSTRIRTGHRRS